MYITLACSEENMVEVVAKEVYIKMCNNDNNILSLSVLIIVVQIYLEMTKPKLLK